MPTSRIEIAEAYAEDVADVMGKPKGYCKEAAWQLVRGPLAGQGGKS